MRRLLALLMAMTLPVMALAEGETLAPGLWYEIRLGSERYVRVGEETPVSAADVSEVGAMYTGLYRLTDDAMLALRPEAGEPFTGAALLIRAENGWRRYDAVSVNRRSVLDDTVSTQDVGKFVYTLSDGVFTEDGGGNVVYDVVDGEVIESETARWSLTGPMAYLGGMAFQWWPERDGFDTENGREWSLFVRADLLPEGPEVTVMPQGAGVRIDAAAHGDGVVLTEVSLIRFTMEGGFEKVYTTAWDRAEYAAELTVRAPGSYMAQAVDSLGQTLNSAMILLEDKDGDGLCDIYEISIGTAPTRLDTDGDGVSDYDEVVKLGTDPLTAE